MSAKSKITFHGGTGMVTGANFLLEAGGLKVMIDCGLIQGNKFADSLNRADFAYKPVEIDFLLVTHSHIDHIGRIPKLVKDGFKGKIISTPATRDLAKLMLEDAVNILDDESRREGTLPIYDHQDVLAALALWTDSNYHKQTFLNDELSFQFKDSGHILGSAMIEFSYQGKKIVFTGDLGNSPSLLLRNTESIVGADYLVMESVYGDRNHESKEERRQKLKAAVAETIKKKWTLIIPAFSLERTQDILYEMNEFVENNELAAISVFMDSPLAIKVTDVYKRYTEDMNKAIKDEIFGGDDIFDFPKLKFTVRKEESQAIFNAPNPKIIIAGSGMSNGGRIVQHEKHYLSNPNVMLLLVGYQAVGTLGRQLWDGAKEVNIFDTKVEVRAKVQMISGYSSHKDSDGLLDFVGDAATTLKKVFVVMGEPKASLFLAQKIKDNYNLKVEYPELGEVVELA